MLALLLLPAALAEDVVSTITVGKTTTTTTFDLAPGAGDVLQLTTPEGKTVEVTVVLDSVTDTAWTSTVTVTELQPKKGGGTEERVLANPTISAPRGQHGIFALDGLIKLDLVVGARPEVVCDLLVAPTVQELADTLQSAVDEGVGQVRTGNGTFTVNGEEVEATWVCSW